MKKFLLILIIAVIACVEVEEKVQKEDELEVILNDLLDSIDFEDPNIVELLFDKLIKKIKDWVKEGLIKGKELIDKVKNVIEKGKDILKDMKDQILKGVDLLKEKGIWDKLVGYVKTGGKAAALKLCSEYLTSAVCTPLIEVVINLIF